MLERRHPLAKFMAALLAIAVLTLTETLTVYAATALAAISLVLASRFASPGRLARLMAPFLVFALTSSWIYLVAANPAHTAMADSGWRAALVVACRILTVGLVSIAFAITTNPSDLARALVHKWRFPRRFVYGALAAIQFMPALVEDYRMARLTALSALGEARDSGSISRRWRAFIAGRTLETALLLMAGALRRANDAALSMQLRGLTQARPTGGWKSWSFDWRDAGLVALTAIWFALAFALAGLRA